MKPVLFWRPFTNGPLNYANLMLGPDRNLPDHAPIICPPPHGSEVAALTDRLPADPAVPRRNITLAAVAIAAAMLAASPFLFRVAPASAQQLRNIEPADTSGAAALYLTLCLWSEHRPVATCRDVPLTPGAAGPVFASIKACQDGQEEALGRWRAQAGPVFGYTDMAGDGYRIQNIRCAPAIGNSHDREQ